MLTETHPSTGLPVNVTTRGTNYTVTALGTDSFKNGYRVDVYDRDGVVCASRVVYPTFDDTYYSFKKNAVYGSLDRVADSLDHLVK